MPFKTFVNGAVLPASDLNDYLMEQAVSTFADATARDAAITAPNEGQFAYTKDDNFFHVYDASAWRPFSTSWTAYTPTLQNVTVGNGTISAFYTRAGRLVVAHILFTLGSTSAITGAIDISLPVPYTNISRFTGTCRMGVAGTTYTGTVIGSAGYGRLYAINTAGTYASVSLTSATVPATWAAGNSFLAQLIYEG